MASFDLLTLSGLIGTALVVLALIIMCMVHGCNYRG